MSVPQHLRDALAPHYEVEREIGAGGMARVYLAAERHPRRQVAVKVLDEDLCSRLVRERFLREVDLSSRLSHPHIVPIFAAGGEECLLYYVMPYLEGESLRHRLNRNGSLPLEEALHIAGDVADALAYAHGQGIIHRDIKPENILLSGGHAIVADFGIARAISAAGSQRLTQAGQPIGSPSYMSPEQALGMALDARTDVYSLGAVLFEMLAGEPPQRLPVDVEVQNWRRLYLAPALQATGSGTQRAIKHAISKAVALRPDDRFATVAEFTAALGGPAHRPSLPTRGWLLARRRWRVVAGAVGFVGLALGVWRFAPRAAALDPGRVVVAVIENHTGDSTLDHLGHLAADWVTQGLAQTGLVEVVPSASAGRGAGHLDAAGIRALGRHSRAGTVISGAYYLQGDSIRFQIHFTDADRGEVVRALDPVVGPRAAPQRSVDLLRQAVMAAAAVQFPPPSRPKA